MNVGNCSNFYINAIKEVCLYAKDLESIKSFYLEKLGFKLIHYKANRHVFFRLGTTVLLCFNPDVTKAEEKLPPHYAVGPQHIAFAVPRIYYEAEKARMLDLGIAITHEEDWGDGWYSFYFEDPAGNILEVVPEGLWER